MNGYECPNCGKVCSRKYGLTNHMKSCTAPQRARGEEVARQGDELQDAFIISQEHLCVLMDVNFCGVLGQFILDNDTDNKAILAFAHRLTRIADDYKEQ